MQWHLHASMAPSRIHSVEVDEQLMEVAGVWFYMSSALPDVKSQRHITEESTATPFCWFCSNSLHFNGHFLGGPGLASTKMSPFWILLELRVMDVVVTHSSYKACKAPVRMSPSANQILQADALPVAQPTVSKHWRKFCSNSACRMLDLQSIGCGFKSQAPRCWMKP